MYYNKTIAQTTDLEPVIIDEFSAPTVEMPTNKGITLEKLPIVTRANDCNAKSYVIIVIVVITRATRRCFQ